MRRFQRRLRSQYRRLGSVFILLGLVSAPMAFATEIQVGRYATVRALPTQEQVQLLTAIVNVVFPASVVTVGQAMRYLLEPGGYRLADEAAASPARAALLTLPLPQAHRALGPMSLRIALDPYHNLRVGAAILQECFQDRQDWWEAVGCYHAPNNAERAAGYRARVFKHWQRLTGRG